MLHDVVEDQEVSFEEIESKFGSDVSYIIQSLTKISNFLNDSKHKHEIISNINTKKILVGMSNDIRVIIIKMADRTHNMLTLQYLRKDKQIRIATETVSLFAPLANRLGMYQVGEELYDLCFKYLHPKEYIKLKKSYLKLLSKDKKNIKSVVNEINILLQEKKCHAKISYRYKSLSSIHNKIMKKQIKINDLYDIRLIKIIVSSNDNCYRTLGIIHAKYHHIHNRFKDYISIPKPNLYKSLHTVIIVDGVLIEVQIKTVKMDNYATYGVAAHWRYKEESNSKKSHGKDYSLNSLQNIQSLIADLSGLNSYDSDENLLKVKQIKNIIKNHDIYVFTPQGNCISLSSGSTVYDFAFSIHSAIGMTALFGIVNGIKRSLDWRLETGSTVEIVTSKKNTLNNNSVNRVTLNKWKHLINKELKRRKLVHELPNIEAGRTMVERFIKKNKIKDEWEENINKLLKYIHSISNYSLHKIDDLYLLVGKKQINVKKVYDSFLETLRNDEISNTIVIKVNKSNNDILFGRDAYIFKFAKCCYPVYNEKIVCSLSRQNALVIHTAKCKSYIKLKGKDKKMFEKPIWNRKHDDKNNYMTKINISSYYSSTTLKKINEILIQSSLKVILINTKEDKKLFLKTTIILHTPNIDILTKLINMIKSLNETITVSR